MPARPFPRPSPRSGPARLAAALATAGSLAAASLAAPATSAAASTEAARPGAPAARSARPNIVFILADDLGWGDVECFGAERCQIATPHYDRLAREGLRFTNAHSAASVCVPSRMALMTGRQPLRFGPPAPGGPWGFLGLRLPRGQTTVARMLRHAGYRTAVVGKWHLGTSMPTTDGKVQGPGNVDYSQPLRVGPGDYGFEESFILPGSLDMYPYVFVRDHRFVGRVTARKGWGAFHRVGPAAEDFEDYKVLDELSSEAERFIRSAAEGARAGRPFFLYLALTAPHTPTSPSPPFLGKSRLGLYGDFVMETDHCVGRVLAALEEASLERDTLVIATSDHGPALYAGRRKKATFAQLRELEKDGHYSSGPFRGYKFSVYEGAFRVPFVARWPGVIPPGRTSDALVGLIDLYATAAEIAGVALGPAEAPDSISLLPLLRNPEAAGARDSIILQGAPSLAFRSGPWKLALCPGSGCAGRYGNSPKQSEAWKAALERFGRMPRTRPEIEAAPFVQLFRLDEDPGESRNLAAEHPGKVRELLARLRRQIAQGRSRPGPKVPNDRERIELFRGVPRSVRSAMR